MTFCNRHAQSNFFAVFSKFPARSDFHPPFLISAHLMHAVSRESSWFVARSTSQRPLGFWEITCTKSSYYPPNKLSRYTEDKPLHSAVFTVFVYVSYCVAIWMMITMHFYISMAVNQTKTASTQTDPSGGCLEWTAMRDNASIVLQKSPCRQTIQCIQYTL